jgi:5-methyltetrahydrofolate--homocysteine methyltransferase
MSEKLINAIADMREEEALALVREMVDTGTDAMVILGQVSAAMDIIGKRYEEGVYFLPELIMAGEIMSQIKDFLQTGIGGISGVAKKGKVLIGTVKGDIHNIGKDIVSFMLEANGYEVMDLGVDVPAEKFTAAIGEFNPQVVGLSGFLTLAFEEMKKTVGEFSARGQRDGIKVMIGGGQMNEQVCKYTGADGYGKDAMAAVKLVKNWIGG